jgi:hypothetical protein
MRQVHKVYEYCLKFIVLNLITSSCKIDHLLPHLLTNLLTFLVTHSLTYLLIHLLILLLT